MKEIPHEEADEVKRLLAEYGISPGVQAKVAEELSKDHSKWVDFMMRFELGLQKPDPGRRLGQRPSYRPLLRRRRTYPLSAYYFWNTPSVSLEYSSATTVLCLLVFGYFKARFTGQNTWKGALTVTLTGILAAGAAFGIAKLING